MAAPKKDPEVVKAEAAARKKRLAEVKLQKEKLKKEAEKGKGDLTDEERLDRLEYVIAKLAHYKGLTKYIREVGITEWIPGKKDMTRWTNKK